MGTRLNADSPKQALPGHILLVVRKYSFLSRIKAEAGEDKGDRNA